MKIGLISYVVESLKLENSVVNFQMKIPWALVVHDIR